jgi:acetyl esterase/lipase
MIKKTLLFLSLVVCSSACKNKMPNGGNNTTINDPKTMPLSKSQAEQIQHELWAEYKTNFEQRIGKQWTSKEISQGSMRMPFFYSQWGKKPADGYPLYISMHGGGGTEKSVNDQQYDNQKHLYDATMRDLTGVYIAPRAPTNNWNLWHEAHIDAMFTDLILLAHIKANINLNKVYLLGYSAGGDGVYQLAPRLADRLAAASMMAGHPNDANPLSLRNLPFSIQMGSDDAAYDRNKVAQQWCDRLAQLAKEDGKNGYPHLCNIHKGQGHWMNLKDAPALVWLSQHSRQAVPDKIVWAYDKAMHTQFYWLALPPNTPKLKAAPIVASYDKGNNSITVAENAADTLYIYADDRMLNLDKPVSLYYQQTLLHSVVLKREKIHLAQTLAAKGDENLMFSARFTLIHNKQVLHE